MNNNINYLDGLSEETINQLLAVSKEILNKAELVIEAGPFYDKGSFWFSPYVQEGINYELVINKIAKLSELHILDQKFQSEPIPHILAYKIEVSLSAFQGFVNDLELRIKSNPNKEDVIRDIVWPEYYRWDESGRNFLVGENKKLSFQNADDDRCKIFNALTQGKGEWVRVASIAKALGIQDKSKIRIVINQIRQRIKANGLSDYLKIESLGSDRAVGQGAYRLVSA